MVNPNCPREYPQFIYLVIDGTEVSDRNKLLKVGISITATRLEGRFQEYRRGRDYLQMPGNQARNVYYRFVCTACGNITTQRPLVRRESKIRTTLLEQGYLLPWDNSSGRERLGHPGRGTPAAFDRNLARSGYRWWPGEMAQAAGGVRGESYRQITLVELRNIAMALGVDPIANLVQAFFQADTAENRQYVSLLLSNPERFGIH
jgi:hypothetical protein